MSAPDHVGLSRVFYAASLVAFLAVALAPGALLSSPGMRPRSMQWALVGGEFVHSSEAVGIYGESFSAQNWPGIRHLFVMVQGRDNNGFLMGGKERYRIGRDFTLVSMNDLWEFSMTLGQWRWIEGIKDKPKTANIVAEYPPEKGIYTSIARIYAVERHCGFYNPIANSLVRIFFVMPLYIFYSSYLEAIYQKTQIISTI